MKPIVLCLVSAFILFSTGYGQSPKYFVGNGEYQNFVLDNTTHTLYSLGTGGGKGIGSNPEQGGYGTKCQFPNANTQIKYVASGLHTSAAVDMSGNVYFAGGNEDGSMGNGTTSGSANSFVQITTDSLGNAFTNVNYIAMGSAIFSGGAGYGACIFAVKNDGTLWVWGNTQGGYRGDGTYGRVNTRPVQVPFPAGTVITKVLISNIAIALDAAGNVWTWAGNGPNNCLLGSTTRTNYESPQKLALAGPAKDIAGGGMWSYALLQSGSLYGWGQYQGYMGVGPTVSEGWANTPAPILLDGQLNLPAQISKISCNKTSTYVILTDGTLWAWGGNECGQIGNGIELNYATYTYNPAPTGGTPSPYAWDWNMSTVECQQHKPAQIGQGLKFVALSEGQETVFYKFAEDVNGQLYSWGRNKAGVCGNGVEDGNYTNGMISATYPNSFDIPWITAVNPIVPSGTPVVLSTSPECISNPGAAYCNIYAIPANTPPIANPGPNQTISATSTTLDGSASSDNVHITYYLWTQVSGPSTALITIPSGIKAQASNLVTGTYKFQLRCIDNGWMKDSAVVTVVVNGGGPTVNAGANQTITLPTNSVSLAGSATETSGTISSYAWTEVSGPSTATFGSANSATSTAGGLVQGTYVFKLTATDNSGVSGNGTVTVTVNPAPSVPPVASAGSDLTITLPTNTVTLVGSGSETGGTIASYSWTQVSGPSTASIGSSGAATTTMNNLVQGTYVFKLTVKDILNVTASATVTVTVNPAPPGAPVANAGTDQTITLPTNSVTLTGTGSETNGTISSYAWSQVSGPSTATFLSATSASTSATNLVQGTYVFKLTIKDNSGVSASDNVNVIVNAATVVPGPPSANAGSDQTITLPTNSVTLTGSGSETNGTISSYAWTQVSGPSTALFSSSTSAATSAAGLIQGSYVFKLTVKDNSGVTASDNITVTVNPAPVIPSAPVANAGSDQTITLPTNSVTLTGSGSETNGTIAGYSWTQVSGPSTAAVGSASSTSTTVSGLVKGSYVFKLTVTDNAGVTASDNITVTVNPAPVTPGAPSANAGNDITITLPTNSATLTGSGSETNGTISSYTWTQVSGPSTAAIGTASSASTTVGSLVQGSYVFKLTVKDNSGVTASDNVNVTVNAAVTTPPTPGAPSANAGPNVTITLPTNSVTLTGSGSETNGSIVSYGWTETGGPSTATIGSASSASTTVSDLYQGTYTFKLEVTDNSGVIASDNVTVTVNAAATHQPPVAVPGPNQTVSQNVASVQLNGSGSYETGGTIVSYDWAQISGLGGVTIANSTTATPSIYGLEPGTYTFELTVTDSYGVTANGTMTVTVTASSSAALVANAGATDTLQLPNNAMTLNGSASTVSSGTITGYSWKEVSGPSTVTIGNTGDSVTTASGFQIGTYTFQLTVTDNSGNTSTATVNVVVVKDERRFTNNVSLYPNPTQSMLNVVYTSTDHSQFSISIYSVSGVNEMTGAYEQESGTATYQLNVTSLARGVYFLVIKTSSGQREVRRFVKQ